MWGPDLGGLVRRQAARAAPAAPAWCDVWVHPARAPDGAATTSDALLRDLVGRYLSRRPEDVVIDRRCPDCDRPHGRPVVRDSDLHVSVSHAGPRLAVAVASAPVGIDVEQVRAMRADPRGPGPAPHGEAAVREVLRQWCRYEAVVKATGDGVRVPFDAVRTDGPHGVELGGAPLACRVLDLVVGPDDVAALAVLGVTDLEVRVRGDVGALRQQVP